MTAKNCGDLTSSVQTASPSRDLIQPLPRTPAEATRRVASGDLPSSGVIALTVEFVAKPKVAQRVKTIIPATIAGAFEGVTGFAGYLVMVSDQEPRLVTVVTLWTGDNPLETTSHDLPKPEQIQAKQSQVHSNHLEESDSQASGKLDDVYGNAELLECSLAH
jgi:hypothetical protein